MNKERKNLFITTFICLCTLLIYIAFTIFYPVSQMVWQSPHMELLLFAGIVINVALNIVLTTLIISKKPGNTGISRDIRTEFTTDLLLSD